ncbi:MAG: DUF4350 domain-containing protein [Planctomycetaceae bacterium]|nr:MAG: DUF4350 domain-containing protein [Planctomycetaceae bacterium]
MTAMPTPNFASQAASPNAPQAAAPPAQSLSSHRASLLSCCVWLLAIGLACTAAPAQQPSVGQSGTYSDRVDAGFRGELRVGSNEIYEIDEIHTFGLSGTSSAELRVGINQIYRIGHWTGVRWTEVSSGNDGDLSSISGPTVAAIETLDPDGVRVRFEQPAPTDASGPAPWSYAVPGSSTAPLRLLDSSGEPIWNGRFAGRPIEPSTPWVVVIGEPLGIERIGQNELLGREATVAVSTIETAADLPDRLAGWEGVDLLVINPPGMPVLQTLDPGQIAALTDWVRQGGRLLVSLGSDGAEMLSTSPWIAELIGVQPGGALIRLDPAALETYVASSVPLPTLDGYPLPLEGGRTLIPGGRTTTRQPARLAMERIVGLGRVGVTAFGLHTAELAAWPDRLTLITRMHPGLLDADTDRRREVRIRSTVGYEDFAGQIHTALDRFDSHRRLPFSIVSLILLGLIAIVGPLDYLLVRRWVGKPLFGWISFPVAIVSVSCLVIFLNGSWGGVDAGPRIGRIEIVDIGATSDRPTARVIGLTHLSSRPATRIDFPGGVTETWAAFAEVGPNGTAASDSNETGMSPTLTRTHGYPGAAFGGITIAGENLTLPPYRVALAAGGEDDSSLAGGPLGFPLPPIGSKSWLTRWTFQPKLGPVEGLAQRRGSELLAGSLTNPLPVDLLDAVLVYGNWSYLLPTRFRSGQRIESVDSLRQKNFRWHLTKREIADNASRLAAWDVEMHDDWQRLTEILMFESSVGGRDYTGLSNRALGSLDMSHALAHGHAILYGRVAEKILEDGFVQERPTVSAARVLLPVGPAVIPPLPTASGSAASGSAAASPP